MPAPVNFTFAQLEHFVAVAECGSIHSAAERLHVSASALSSSIMKLEAAVRTRLFVRSPSRRLALSPDGRSFLTETRGLLQHAWELHESTDGNRRGETGRLSVGCFLPLAPIAIPRAIDSLRASGSCLHIDLLEGDTRTLQRAIQLGECELAVCYLLCPQAELQFEEVTRKPFHVLLARSHPLAGREEVTVAELADLPWVRFEIPESVQVVETELLALGYSAQPSMASANFETVRGLVAATGGFAVLTARAATELTASGHEVVAVRLRGLTHELRLGILSAPRPLSQRARAFLPHLRTALESL